MIEPETMARLSRADVALVSEVAALTHSTRDDVVRQALEVYRWFVRQAVTGARVVARRPSGEEVTLETAALATLEGQGQRLGPDELASLGRKLAKTKDPAESERLRERLTRGFYGI
jgi:hypothetical protein